MRRNDHPARVIPGTLPRVLYKNIRWQDEYGVEGWERSHTDPYGAEVVSSEIGPDVHAPVLDIDFPAALVPSSTEGHYHLYLDVTMSWRSYKRLLKALAAAGVVEEGYVKASIRRRHTAVRVPWLKKEKA